MNGAGREVLIGIDLGGTKIEGIALDDRNGVLAGPLRQPTPRHNYAATLSVIGDLVRDLSVAVDAAADRRKVADVRQPPFPVGCGIPGSIAAATGLVQNANSVWLNGRPFAHDLSVALGRPVAVANDANCFALSEARDGAAAGAGCVFGVILGTGCGGGLVVDGRVWRGSLGIAGEWGHTPLPRPGPHESPGPSCWCGRTGCLEAWLSGPALAVQYASRAGQVLDVPAIVAASEAGDRVARDVIEAHAERFARGLATVVNIVDPDVVVLGGGLSNLTHLYRDLPELMRPHLFADDPRVNIRSPRWGDSGGVRGAAWLAGGVATA